MKGPKKITKMSKIDNIYKLLSEGERVTLECKKASKGLPASLWETYSAFANTYGGTILLGVVEHMDETDKSKRFEIVGVDDADKIRKNLWDIVNNKEKVNVNLLKDDDVQKAKQLLPLTCLVQIIPYVPSTSMATCRKGPLSAIMKATIIVQSKN